MRADIFKKTVLQHFNFYKNTENVSDAQAKAIHFDDKSGYLLPVCRLHLEDTKLIDILTEWRNTNVNIYPSRFVATRESTQRWLRDRLLATEDRMLFLIYDRFANLVGHIGYASCFSEIELGKAVAEIDNVVRGVKGVQPGIMATAMNTLVRWAQEKLLVDEIFLRVLADNSHAVDFYRRNNFVEGSRIPLYFEKKDNETVLKQIEQGSGRKKEAEFIRMTYRPNADEVGKTMILTAGPSISSLESYYVNDAVNTGWNHKWADYLTRFENEFKAYVGTEYAMATSSCTGGLHIALAALEIGPGDEVIVPDITWVATANAVMYVGATPVFCDVDPKTWVMDSKSFASKITSKTKAVMPVHLYGHVCPMDEIMKIARDNKLYVVEDAAPSIGAEFNGKRTGSFGDFAAFSFQGAKLTVTGEGGMLVTSNKELYEKAKNIWDQGRDPKKTFWINSLGWKYKMSNVQAALGLGQLQRTDALIEAKRRIFSWYEEILRDQAHLDLCYEPAKSRSIYWMTSISLKRSAKFTADQLRAELKKRNVDTRPVFPAISQYEYWPRRQAPQPNAKIVGETSINLPTGVCMKKEEVQYVARQIVDLL